jgi:broad specificity phosphatase PhoE
MYVLLIKCQNFYIANNIIIQMLLFVLFCGGGNLKTDWIEYAAKKSTLVDELKHIGDVYMYDPPFYLDHQRIKQYQNSQEKYLFDLTELDIVTHCKNVYNDIKTKQKLFLISWSRGYMYANIFGKLYADQIIGYINIDGGKPDDEYEHILATTVVDDLNIVDLFEQIKQSVDEKDVKAIKNKISKYVMYKQFEQYKKTKTKLTFPCLILNNIYNDSDVPITNCQYTGSTLRWKMEYNADAQKLINAKSIWYVGKKHWLHMFNDVVKDIIHFVNDTIDNHGPKKEIYIVRHGETDWNKKGLHLAQGSRNDIEINQQGKSQALLLGEYLKNHRINDKPFDLILSSPLKRTLETSVIIAKQIGYCEDKIIKLNELIETDHGLLSLGKTMQEMKNDPFYEDFFEQMDQYNHYDLIKQHEIKDDIPDIFITKYKMESNDKLINRINKIIQYIKLSDCEKILIVTHADTIRFINRVILNSVSEIKDDLSAGKNCHLTYYKLENGRFKMIMAPSTFYLKN